MAQRLLPGDRLNNMNILALDYGKKRIGLAWADTAIGAPLPYGVIEAASLEEQCEKMTALTKEEKIDLMVIGIPFGLDGKENDNTKAVRAFIEGCKKSIDIPIEYIDERFTSAEADRMGGEATRDEKAAMLILQTYVEKHL